MLFLRKSKTNSLLASLILSFSLCLGYYIIFWTGYYRSFPWQLGAAQGLTLLFGPLAYFYLRSDHKVAVLDSRHFIAFLLYVSYFILDIPPRTIPDYCLALFQITHLVAYTLLNFKWLSHHKGYRNGALKRYRWRIKVALAFAGYTVSFLFYYILVWTGLLRIEYDYMISVASSAFIYFIGYHGFQKQEVLKMNEPSKYEKSALDIKVNQSIMHQVHALMKREKVYLRNSLKLQELATQLNITPHHLSQAINESDGKNFSDFINSYRVADAKKQLVQTDHKIIRIAYDTGFNNKVSFYNAFKKVANMSPGEYRNQALTQV